ncbi:MAG: hypothetical protein U1F33_14540 [Alphaproteobacteria bacterium]
MIDAKQLYAFVITPVLGQLGLNSLAARRLVLGTAMTESALIWLDQRDAGAPVLGPALGLWQMERLTHDDIWTNYLAYRKPLRAKVEGYVMPGVGRWEQLVGNLLYGCAMCRVHYQRRLGAMPDPDDLAALARAWKEHYNTVLGSGTVTDFMNKASTILAFN